MKKQLAHHIGTFRRNSGGVIAYCLKWKKPSLKVFYSGEDFPMTA
ncbi:hypothetical protein [Photorhabdus laumondii]